MYLVYVAVVFFIILSVNCENNFREYSYDGLPPIFHIDNYDKCRTEQKLFCKVSVVLRDGDLITSPYWRLIEESVKDSRAYNHKELFHAICVNDFCPGLTFDEDKKWKKQLAQCYTKKYEHLGLAANISSYNCSNHDNVYKAGTIDIIWLLFLLCYACYIIFASFYNYVIQHTHKKRRFISEEFENCKLVTADGGLIGNDYLMARLKLIKFSSCLGLSDSCSDLKGVRMTSPRFLNFYLVIWFLKFFCILVKSYLIPFSVVSNWNKLRKENTNTDFQKLKSMQGIRFYNMLLIIFCHTYSSYIGGYVLNTSYIENIPNSTIKLGLRNLFVFLVQTFFLFSAFLLSYHIFQIMETYPVFNKRFILLTFLNRYLRIIPPVLVMIGFGSTIWIVSLCYGPIKDLYSDLEYQRCQKNWWTTLLFINNHYNQYDMCYFITWYLAADTQLYVLSLILLSVVWKFRKHTKKILAFSVMIGILIPTVISFIYNLDFIYRITPENAKNNKFRSFKFNAIYSSSYANMATYMVGICGGYVYFKFGKYNIFQKLVFKLLWWISFLGLPTLVVIVSSHYYSRVISAILCGILKPLYALGIAIGILGMSQRIGGIVRQICEWKPAVFMGNFTYSTYVVHYGIVFYRTATAKKPLYVSDFVLITSFIYDATFSFFCGFLMHILVEMPALQIQNMVVPQVRKQRGATNNIKN